jgi:hypothetical protein
MVALALIAICAVGFVAIVRNSLRWKLQKLGHVPEDARHPSYPDGWKIWSAAESTSWWGKPLDPAEFWKGRVIWKDHSAEDAAHRRGRYYPPIPTHLTNSTLNGDEFSSLSHKDYAPSRWSFTVDSGPVIAFHENYAERAYWDWFSKHQPKPPDAIHTLQLIIAHRVLAHPADGAEKPDKQDLLLGYPPEALTRDAILWEYVFQTRAEYERLYVHDHLDHTLFSSIT